MTRHFLRDDDLTPAEQAEVLALAATLKADPFGPKPLAGPVTVATIYDRPTLRTQLSFAAGVAELGGHEFAIDAGLAAAGTRESIADVARVIGRQAGAMVWRTPMQADVEEMARYAGVPVVNALTDDFHPCQLLADLQTIAEHQDGLHGQTVAFLGDAACNMGNSWVLAGATAGLHVRLSGPEGYLPDPDVVARGQEIAATTGGSVTLVDDPVETVTGADVVVTDTWVSMGKEDEKAERVATFGPWALTPELLAHAADHAIVMHCLPAYRGVEIAAEVIDGPQSAVWDEAENRRHAQKAILTWLWEHRAD
ncbi:ornithine carbamoyltransferase [Kytococcus schroeteri]|uniref:ornithine carbamoyltransferase n=1 Tax=Kytococcus schroeteri TaxID=138300 RepID=UPI0011451068|nr:ornithine carbamoyltransferase [Kytococcus schroeteri]